MRTARVVSLALIVAACSKSPDPSGTGGGSATAGGSTAGGNVAGGSVAGGSTGPNTNPVASFTAPMTATAHEPVLFDATASSDPDGDALTFSWQFGDGTRGGTAKQAHVYAKAASVTVTLTVSDGRGGSATTTRTLTVNAGPAATQQSPLKVRVRSSGNARLQGVVLKDLGGTATATTGATGEATLTLGAGVVSRVSFTKEGYASQVKVVTVPTAVTAPQLEVTMLPRAGAVQMAQAELGGTLTGTAGAKLTLPPNALVDASGAAVTGPVDVTLSPLDVSVSPEAFPGRYEGTTSSGTTSPIVSMGTVEYTLTQNGEALNLKPGTRAQIEIPIFVGKNIDGGVIQVGESIPLWSLDEATGAWVEEGAGTVALAANDPQQKVLRGEVGHFSWWNGDCVPDTGKARTRCCYDLNLDMVCDSPFECWVRGTSNCPNDFGVCSIANDSPPAFMAETLLAAGAEQELIIPGNQDLYFVAYSTDFGKKGSAKVRVSPGATQTVTFFVSDVVTDPGATPIGVPWDVQYPLSAMMPYPRYSLDVNAGQLATFTFSRLDAGSQQGGDVRMTWPDQVVTDWLPFHTGPAKFALKFPVSGRYGFEVKNYGLMTGVLRLQVESGAQVPYVLETFPVWGQTVAADAGVAIRFSNVLAPMYQANQITFERADLAGDIPGQWDAGVTRDWLYWTPYNDRQPTPGMEYEVNLTQYVRVSVDGGAPLRELGVPYRFQFRTADEVGAEIRFADSHDNRVAGFADGTLVASSSNSQNTLWGNIYTPGFGWSRAKTLETFSANQLFRNGFASDGVDTVMHTYFKQLQLRAQVWTRDAGWLGVEGNLSDGGRNDRVALGPGGRGIVTWQVPFGFNDWTNRYAQRIPGTLQLTPASALPATDGGGAESDLPTAAYGSDGTGVIAWGRTPNGMWASIIDKTTGVVGAPTWLGGGYVNSSVAIVRDNGDAFVMWNGALVATAGIRVARWEAATGTWHPNELLSGPAAMNTACQSDLQLLDVSPSQVLAIGCSNNNELWARTWPSADGGWEPKVLLLEPTSMPHYLAAGTNHRGTAWLLSRNATVGPSLWKFDGATWSAPIAHPSVTGGALYPYVFVNDAGVTVIHNSTGGKMMRLPY
ncbi:MAG: PKD domain-containing protein [Myxococcaceae bacterium]|nr:PKD domain-containing protein [Myxococcaceae bacterium]